MKIYLAGPIFTYGDLLRNTEWAAKVRKAIPGVDLYSPVENTDINGVEGKKKFAGSQEIANALWFSIFVLSKIARPLADSSCFKNFRFRYLSKRIVS